MTTVAVIFGVVALVSIGINIHLSLRLQKDNEREWYRQSEIKGLRSSAKIANIRSEDLQEKLLAANAKLAKYDRKRDPKTGKIVKG
jgi:hypothetical protein